MLKTEDIHIIELTKNLVDRLTTIKFKPESVFCEGVEESLIIKSYPTVYFEYGKKVDLILSITQPSPNIDLAEIIIKWKKHIKSEGLILFVLVGLELDIRELGDVLTSQGFRDVVLDYEDNNIFGHALGPKEVRITANQIRRAD